MILTENDSIPVRICFDQVHFEIVLKSRRTDFERSEHSDFWSSSDFWFDYFNKKCFQVYFDIERRVLKTYKNTFQKYLKICPWLFLKFFLGDTLAFIIARNLPQHTVWIIKSIGLLISSSIYGHVDRQDTKSACEQDR